MFRRFVENRLCAIILIAVTLVSVFSRMRAGPGALAFYDDDFFYYMKIATNLASGHGSTFDGFHQTNGYHPLWLVILTCLAKLFSKRIVLFLVLCIIVLSTVITYIFAFACFERFTKNKFIASLSAAAIAFSALLLVSGGMEILLTIPMTVMLCHFRIRHKFKWSVYNATWYALLACLIVLSRLDAALFVGTLFILELIYLMIMRCSLQLKAVVALFAGMSPLAIYAVINLRIFGTLLPISGQAKQLRIHHGFSLEPLQSIRYNFTLYVYLLIVVPSVLIVLFSILRVATIGWAALPAQYRPIVGAITLFPIIHLVTLSWLSDWPLWQWYLYSFILAELGAGIILLNQDFEISKIGLRRLEGLSAFLLFTAMAVYALHRLHGSKHPEEPVYAIYNAAVKIEHFSLTHPGVYAMGDRAGTPGYLLDEPLIQTEGLVMDAAYLSNIKREANLIKVLQQYHVNYLIVTFPIIKSGCYSLREPRQAGPDSHSMSGTICDVPVDHFFVNGAETDIFVLEDQQKRENMIGLDY